MTRDTAFLADILTTGFSPQEVSLVSFTIQLSAFTRKQLYRRLQQAYASGSLKLVKRIHVRFCRKVRSLGQNPKIGYQKFNDLQTAKISKKQLCDRTAYSGKNGGRGRAVG